MLPMYMYVKLFNLIFATSLSPETWTLGQIKPKYRNKRDPKQPESYRSITLLSSFGKLFTSITEPRHDKTNKVSVRPAKTQISLGIRVFAVRMKKPCVLSYPLSAQQILWSDWADAQADLSLRWAHTHSVGFVMSRLN